MGQKNVYNYKLINKIIYLNYHNERNLDLKFFFLKKRTLKEKEDFHLGYKNFYSFIRFNKQTNNFNFFNYNLFLLSKKLKLLTKKNNINFLKKIFISFFFVKLFSKKFPLFFFYQIVNNIIFLFSVRRVLKKRGRKKSLMIVPFLLKNYKLKSYGLKNFQVFKKSKKGSLINNLVLEYQSLYEGSFSKVLENFENISTLASENSENSHYRW